MLQFAGGGVLQHRQAIDFDHAEPALLLRFR